VQEAASEAFNGLFTTITVRTSSPIFFNRINMKTDSKTYWPNFRRLLRRQFGAQNINTQLSNLTYFQSYGVSNSVLMILYIYVVEHL
jgi:hypothetical protein